MLDLFEFQTYLWDGIALLKHNYGNVHFLLKNTNPFILFDDVFDIVVKNKYYTFLEPSEVLVYHVRLP